MPAKATAGQPLRISAKDWNALLDVLTQALSDRLSVAADPIDRSLPPGCVWLENTTTEDRDAGDVMGLDGPIWSAKDSEDEYKKARGMRGVAVDRDKHLGKFAVLMDAIPAGQFGRARVSGGPIAVKLEVRREVHRFADVVTSTPTSLRTGRFGAAEILYVEPSDEAEGSLRRAIVTLGPLTAYKLIGRSGDIDAATVDGDVITPGSGTVTLLDYVNPPDDEEEEEEGHENDHSPTEETVTALHFGSKAIPEDSLVQLAFDGENFLIDVRYC